MEQFNIILFFILGSILGSFYHVIGTRLPNKESILKPNSHCNDCNHELQWYELIPLISYIIQFGRCRVCGAKIPISTIMSEVITGTLFALCYRVWGLNIEIIVNLVFVSCLIIVIISDIEYMIILDEVIVIGSILILLISLFTNGFHHSFQMLFSGSMSFFIMLLVKLFGDMIFKKESLGGGDIKLMFLIGLTLGFDVSILTIFLSAIVAFPVSIYTLLRTKDHMIPYGPFLSISAILLVVLDLNVTKIIEFIL